MGHSQEFEQTRPVICPCLAHLAHRFVVICGDSSLPRPGPLSKFLGAVKGEKALPQSFGP